MGPGKRGLITATVAVACAVTVLAVPGPAFADPGPTPAPTAAVTPDKDLQAVRETLDRLYREAAAATDRYNAAEERAEEQSAQVVELAKKIVEGRKKLDALERRAAAAARSQYRTGGLPDEAKLLLSDDPAGFLDGAGRVLQGQRAAKGLIGDLRRAQESLEGYAADASARWKELEANRRAKAAAQRRIEKRVAAAEKLESELAREEKERLARLEREAAERAQNAWLDSGVLADADGAPTERAEQAVEYATAQIGKPYVWGAEGPKSFDCSGLTSRAWAAAGHGIPRTSQEQWRRLRHVATEDIRPGDLVVYFEDASHVGMYVGDGKVVHAPRPGRSVTITGAGTMPILGVVRPEA
ncbi:NlpC/P60 family protein [Streptomyces griseoviridis]|uniref:Glycoside hydrolase n=1 Tax=Streptomyces griseoviridis TaxID=45398 RepID=A0A918GSR3_STRGD|nr:C40 family peptidase [Streptomyces niveoruber]GGS58688.1 glycoside hydrolase [Streptomyces niveoruber]